MFNQIEVDERDIEKTAITTPFGLYECPLMPFGLINAPATAVKLMHEVLRGLNGKTCYVYFDDIIVYAKDLYQLVQRCEQVFQRLREHNLKLKPSKCFIAVESVRFLGHIISAKGVEIDERRIKSVKEFPTPRNPTDVRKFHGICNYNRKFIKDFAKIAKPLTHLMGKKSDFVWTPEAQQAFETLRDALIKTPILVHFNPDADLELRTDASAYALGAVLYQKHIDPSHTGVILYHSRTLTSVEQKGSATQRELLAAYDSITNLQHYLYGKRFTLITDHQALSLLRNNKDPHHKLARWVAQLQEYDFEVKYKNGSKHVDADCLSRLTEIPVEEPDVGQLQDLVLSISALNSEPVPNNVQSDEPQLSIESEQRSDDFCKKYIDILESDTISDSVKATRAKNFTLQDGVLYKRHRGGERLLVVPARRRDAILLSFHDVPLAGHLGFSKTYSVIKSRYYWPKIRRDVKKYVLSCQRCQVRKIPGVRKQGLIKPLPIAEDVFDTVGIDLITKLPESTEGFTNILVCTDNLSKYVITVPLKDGSSQNILHAFFNYVIAKHGCPKVVISDRGANLIGERSRDFFRLFGIKRHLTSGYHPQSNGQTERFNRTLAASLTSYVSRNQKDWPDFIQAITFAYNISEHAVTRVSPYELIFKCKPRLPIDNLMNRNEFIDPLRPAPEVMSTTAIQLMKKHILDSQEANKKRLDASRTPSRFAEGDMVLIERPTRIQGTANKLKKIYIGPYKIQRKISDLSFEIANVNGRGPMVVHPCHLKNFVPRDGDVTDEFVDPGFIIRGERSAQPPDNEDAETVSAWSSDDEEHTTMPPPPHESEPQPSPQIDVGRPPSPLPSHPIDVDQDIPILSPHSVGEESPPPQLLPHEELKVLPISYPHTDDNPMSPPQLVPQEDEDNASPPQLQQYVSNITTEAEESTPMSPPMLLSHTAT